MNPNQQKFTNPGSRKRTGTTSGKGVGAPEEAEGHVSRPVVSSLRKLVANTGLGSTGRPLSTPSARTEPLHWEPRAVSAPRSKILQRVRESGAGHSGVAPQSMGARRADVPAARGSGVNWDRDE